MEGVGREEGRNSLQKCWEWRELGEKREERGGRSTGSRGSWERRGKKEVAEVQGVEGVGREEGRKRWQKYRE